MTTSFLSELFSLDGKVAVVTGGTGILGGEMARGLAAAGARVAVLGRRASEAEARTHEIQAAGGEAMPISADVLVKEQLEAALTDIRARWGHVDILVNAAGGNMPGGTITPDQRFFDAPLSALEAIFDLNAIGTLLPSQVFGAAMAEQREGCIVNISSMAALQAMTRVVAYGAAKAAVDNFTRWLAVELAQKYGDKLRVNAIAPGFFIGDQNRSLLLNADDTLTARGKTIIAKTPAGRFGAKEELVSTLIWLCRASFVTGVVIPVDGGFSAFSGV